MIKSLSTREFRFRSHSREDKAETSLKYDLHPRCSLALPNPQHNFLVFHSDSEINIFQESFTQRPPFLSLQGADIQKSFQAFGIQNINISKAALGPKLPNTPCLLPDTCLHASLLFSPSSWLSPCPRQFSSVAHVRLSRVRLFATPWTAARQVCLSLTNSRSLLKLMPIESVMPSNHLILCPRHIMLIHEEAAFSGDQK